MFAYKKRSLKYLVMCIFSLSVMINGTSKADNPAKPVSEKNKFCNLIFVDHTHDLPGLKRFVDGAKERGIYSKIKFSLILHSQTAVLNNPEHHDYYRSLYEDGHEIGVYWAQSRKKIADWLEIPVSEIVFAGSQLFADPYVEEQARLAVAGFRASANVCIEGDSFKEELWDIPHNWEGAPYLPYWTQWDAERPKSTSRVNRELDKSKAVLELQFATRTMREAYDRLCIPECFHFGEPTKGKSSHYFSPVVKKGDLSWWRKEIIQLEKNLNSGNTPFLYINTASEMNIFIEGGPWSAGLNPTNSLECALELVEMLLDREWQLITVSDFVDFYEARWPCPDAPSAAFLMEDSLKGHEDRDGNVFDGNGRMLRVETKHFQITDHEKRMSPEMIVAYDLRTPNLLRGGYTFGEPDVYCWGDPTLKKNMAQYSSTTGNAVFWSPTKAIARPNGEPYFHSSKPADAYNRTYTLYLGDEWEPYQFAESEIENLKRNNNKISWSKVMNAPIDGTDIKLRYDNLIDGAQHIITARISGKDAVGKPVKLRLCPYFHQGWDTDHNKDGEKRPQHIPDPSKAGQERNVFVRVYDTEFGFSESNNEIIKKNIALRGGRAGIHVFNRNPGNNPVSKDWTIDDNPDMNRGLTLSLDGSGENVKILDYPGPNSYVTVVVEFGKHEKDKFYEFTFEYWNGNL
jgi:hypothetical protein